MHGGKKRQPRAAGFLPAARGSSAVFSCLFDCFRSVGTRGTSSDDSRNGAASEKIEDGADFAHIIDTWMADPQAYQRVRENFLKLRYEEDPTILIEEVVGLANEVAGANLERRPFPPE